MNILIPTVVETLSHYFTLLIVTVCSLIENSAHFYTSGKGLMYSCMCVLALAAPRLILRAEYTQQPCIVVASYDQYRKHNFWSGVQKC
ncbi:hypothetical protein BD289DRAFT_420154 [Coniella lustricola]|uniref:Uncharacterized protein n=1 Tax=Coniella lustricola TaxID=2025994 RepID=A0A2T3AMU5_9PEZI|nr:hypothetical protein BD289DRAFT_420154 [Coniella lustricola]